MLRGISFQVPNKWGMLLLDMLQGIAYDNYIWKIKDSEVYTKGGDFLFATETLSGKLFKEHISTDPYYMVFANLQAFPNHDDICEIKDYSDFTHCACEFIVLVSDNIFVDIYSKKQNEIKLLHKNALKHKFIAIKLITDANDTRKIFRAI